MYLGYRIYPETALLVEIFWAFVVNEMPKLLDLNQNLNLCSVRCIFGSKAKRNKGISHSTPSIPNWPSHSCWKGKCLWWSWRSVESVFAQNWTMWWTSGSDTLMTMCTGTVVTLKCFWNENIVCACFFFFKLYYQLIYQAFISNCSVHVFGIFVMNLNLCFLFKRIFHLYWEGWEGLRRAEVCLAAG